MRKVIFMMCVASLFLVSACKSDKEKPGEDQSSNSLNPDLIRNPATASSSGSVESRLPVFKFEKESYDFGSINEGESVSYAFKFKNSGKSDLVISTASGSCGCTVPEYPKGAISPGKEGVINVTFNSNGKQGMQHKTVTIIANTIPNSKVLTITGEVVKK